MICTRRVLARTVKIPTSPLAFKRHSARGHKKSLPAHADRLFGYFVKRSSSLFHIDQNKLGHRLQGLEDPFAG